MIGVGKCKLIQNSLLQKICFDLYLAVGKEISIYKGICPNGSAVERHKGVSCLHEVRLAEERRNLVSAVTTISTNALDLRYCWSCVSIYEMHLQATVAQYYSLLLHLGSELEKSLLGRWCVNRWCVFTLCVCSTSLHLDGQWKDKQQWRKDKKMWSTRHKLYLLNKMTNCCGFCCCVFFLCIESCVVFTTSHMIHHSDRGQWLYESSKIFASNNVEKWNIFIYVSTFRRKLDVALLSHENSECKSQAISNWKWF